MTTWDDPEYRKDNYAFLRAFAACVDLSDAPVRDAAELPLPKAELETALFLAFNGMGTRDQVDGLKGLLVQLGFFIDLSEADRRAIASLKTLAEAKKASDDKTIERLTGLLSADIDHYKVVLSRALKSANEMHKKVDAFDKYYNVTGRLNAHS
jgi:hypothetical protein